MEEAHCEDLRNVNDGDSVEITTTEGQTIEAECVNALTQTADPRSGEIRETNIWEFQAHGMDGTATIYASILEGLRSSEDDPEFPQHSSLYNETADVNLGYIESIQIHGPTVE